MKRIHFKKAQYLAGFVNKTAAHDSTGVEVAVSGFGTSDDPRFHVITDKLFKVLNTYSKEVKFFPDGIFNFIYIVHVDGSADLYLNTQLEMYIRPKQDIEAGALVTTSQIADIRKLKFSDITITESDRIFCCFKSNWKFGYYFNFPPKGEKLELDDMEEACGAIYRQLKFQHVYQTLEEPAIYPDMTRDGWFPFCAILDEFEDLKDIYKDKIDTDHRLAAWMDKVDKKIEPISQYWWNHPAFKNKQKEIEAGISAYQQGDERGYIYCIKTLYPLVEGILRKNLLQAGGDGNGKKLSKFINELLEDYKGKNSKYGTLLLAEDFLSYIQTTFDARFYPNDKTQITTRNTIAHGNAHEFTRSGALQGILMLDQLFFYLN